MLLPPDGNSPVIHQLHCMHAMLSSIPCRSKEIAQTYTTSINQLKINTSRTGTALLDE
jgi:hypothetical protein